MRQNEFEGKAWTVWTEELSTKAPSTQKVYLRNFKSFLERWNYTPEELFESRMRDLESSDPRDQKNVERKVRVYMNELLEIGKAPASVRQVSKSVASFLEAQGLDLKLKAKEQPRIITNGQSLALVEEIRIMWDKVSPEMRDRNRALIAALKDSGLRVSDISLLDVEDWLGAKSIEVNGETFKVFATKSTKKTGELANIHMGPEAVESIEAYLAGRGSGPIFLGRGGKRITDNALSRQLKYIGLKTGSPKVSGHSLRKFHRTRLEGAGMPESWVKRLQGKKASVYSHPEETGELTQKYIECYHALRIFGEQASTLKMDEQAERIRDLEAEIARLQNGQGDVESLRAENREIREQMAEIWQLLKKKEADS